MTTTQNLHLPQWEADDRIMRTDFNDAMSKIDAALGEMAQALSEGSNCKIVFGTYVGTGTRGSYGNEATCNKLTFDSKPLVVHVGCHNYQFTAIYASPDGFLQRWSSSDSARENVTWSGNSIIWYSSSSASDQLNTSGTTYYYVALLQCN